MKRRNLHPQFFFIKLGMGVNALKPFFFVSDAAANKAKVFFFSVESNNCYEW
jgi:hypothetical protein